MKMEDSSLPSCFLRGGQHILPFSYIQIAIFFLLTPEQFSMKWMIAMYVSCFNNYPLQWTLPIGSMVLLYMVTWIPSIYPLYVSINIPAPWILWVMTMILANILDVYIPL